MEEAINSLLASPWWLLLAALGIPALFMRRIEKKMDKRAQESDEREKRREKLERMQLQSNAAAMALAEATARAVQRIPDAHCNGDMHAALEYAQSTKHKQKDFLTELGIHALHDD